jgi:multidrug efflux pump subunit AcrB
VFAAALIFVTLVPALKIRVDGALERFGVNRRKAALGTSGLLERVLRGAVDVARRGALAVIVVAVSVGAVGAFAYTGIDRQGFQEDFVDDEDWQTDLPEPIGWSAHETEYRTNLDYVRANFQSDVERDRATTLLLRGDVASTTALERVQAGAAAAGDSELTYKQGGEVPTTSVLALVRDVAVEDPAFAATLTGVGDANAEFRDLLDDLAADDPAFADALEAAPPAASDGSAQTRAADTRVGGDVRAVYDALYESAPEETANVLERRDGEYRSMRVIVPVEQGLDVDEQGEEMHALAEETAGESGLSVVPIGFATVSNAGLGEIADGILETMLLAFAGVALVLAGMYHFERESASLGAITVVPIAVVIGLVFGGMYLFDIPLTFITAFLASITIGLGIDYNIHVSDRFAQELDGGLDPVDALYETVTGTGGALLGSALTSSAAFATLLVHPSPVFQSFGFIVVVALLLSFAVSVLVFPSLLLWWARRVGVEDPSPESHPGGPRESAGRSRRT